MEETYKKFKVSFYEDTEHKKLTARFYAMSQSKTEMLLFAQAICSTYNLYKEVIEL